MSVTEIPETDRTWGYDYTNGNWVRVATNASGAVSIARGETLQTARVLPISNNSGGDYIGSGAIDRLIISIPNVGISGTNNYAAFWLSGVTDGAILIGGVSGQAPYSDTNFAYSSFGMYIGPGQQKTIYIESLDQIKACAVRSGDPLSYVAEITTA